MGLIDLMRSAEAHNVQDDAQIYKAYVEYMDEKARLVGSPQFGVLELTPRCNFDCKMCYVHLDKEQMQGVTELTREQWFDIIDAAIDAGMLRCQLTGGEAMLHPAFNDIYLYLYNKGIHIAVMTNGLLLNRERIDFFKKYPPETIQITIYGSDDEGYERLTGIRACDVVHKNIVDAKEIGCRIIVTATPSTYFRADDVRKLIEFTKEYDLKYQINNDLVPPREGTGRNVEAMELSTDEHVAIKKIQASAVGYNVEPFEAEAPIPATALRDVKENKCGLCCSAGRSLFCVNWKGQMHACLDLEFHEDLLSVPFKDAWKRINEQAKKYIVPVECFECVYVDQCNPCPVIHAKGAEPGHADKRVCDRTLRYVKEGLINIDK